MMRKQVLKSYRNLFRAGQSVFRGDAVALRKAKTTLRNGYLERAGLTDASEIERQVHEANVCSLVAIVRCVCLFVVP